MIISPQKGGKKPKAFFICGANTRVIFFWGEMMEVQAGPSHILALARAMGGTFPVHACLCLYYNYKPRAVCSDETALHIGPN